MDRATSRFLVTLASTAGMLVTLGLGAAAVSSGGAAPLAAADPVVLPGSQSTAPDATDDLGSDPSPADDPSDIASPDTVEVVTDDVVDLGQADDPEGTATPEGAAAVGAPERTESGSGARAGEDGHDDSNGTAGENWQRGSADSVTNGAEVGDDERSAEDGVDGNRSTDLPDS
ncbi:hypothetical protein RN607_12115 [Demequina capsici]|uniref:Uncharacterized protein n=1 Tax=Demequina capsici TaxID=3075620 RepID=A0AA96F6A1_9MICO|nr:MULTISPECIES: hypothetical protein [unclassified Demequina]WNM24109.1 hypothetical protein RN606_12175 [Demequina sp. OYTSA14]WNM26937.1 hypothetical protein RN607_12115 [Demequina sp. PMTSA13]